MEEILLDDFDEEREKVEMQGENVTKSGENIRIHERVWNEERTQARSKRCRSMFWKLWRKWKNYLNTRHCNLTTEVKISV